MTKPDFVTSCFDMIEGCWVAYDDRDPDGIFAGEGRTEKAAIDDLFEQIRTDPAEHYRNVSQTGPR